MALVFLAASITVFLEQRLVFLGHLSWNFFVGRRSSSFVVHYLKTRFASYGCEVSYKCPTLPVSDAWLLKMLSRLLTMRIVSCFDETNGARTCGRNQLVVPRAILLGHRNSRRIFIYATLSPMSSINTRHFKGSPG